MTRWIARRGLVCAVLWTAGCGLVPTDSAEDGTCQQTYEFGNYGCARLVVIVEGPPQPWPAVRRVDVRAVPAREGTGSDVALAPFPDTGAVPLGLIRWHAPAPGSGDTASVWVSARMFDDRSARLTPFAADSVLHVARFAPVGSRAPLDTVWLTLRRP
jgi:hypothetical protein